MTLTYYSSQMNYASARRRNRCAALLGCARAHRQRRRTSRRRFLPAQPHPYRRRFARDGDVPVTVVHVHVHDHDDGAGINGIDAARQALREQVAAREQAEPLLQEARTTIQTLETKLATSGSERTRHFAARRTSCGTRRPASRQGCSTLCSLLD